MSDEDIGEAVTVGWCGGEPEAIEATKKATHDTVITLAGARRRGGVGWVLIEDAVEANKFLDRCIDTLTNGPGDIDHYEHYRQIRALVREYGGVIVVASAPAVQP